MMKKEIYCGFDINEFNRVRDVLDNTGIKHMCKVTDLVTPSCLAGELSGARTAVKNVPTKLHYVYVGNDDYEKAKMIIKE